MTIDELIKEGERLSKPCLLLDETPTGTGVIAFWGGRGRAGYSGRKTDRHRITIDCQWLSQHGVRVHGSLGVYDVDDQYKWVKPIYIDYQRDLPLSALTMQDGTPLYGHEATSFPPIMAVCLYGGAKVQEWIGSLGYERTDYDLIENTDQGEGYQREWIKRCPLYSNACTAVLGGWHAMWPEDHFYMPSEMRLVLWTFRDAEPWIEVWERMPNFRVELRIT